MTVSTKLAELGKRARREARLTNVIQFVDEELLRLAFRSMRKQAAPGIDGQRYEDYAANLPRNLRDLYARLKTGRYRAPVIRRVYIPKGNGKRRPIGITMIASYCLSCRYSPESGAQVMRVRDPLSARCLNLGSKRDA